MNRKTKIPAEQPKRAEIAGIRPGISPLTIVAAVLGILMIAFLLVLTRDSFGLRTRIAALLSADTADGANDGDGQNVIPSMTKEPVEPERMFFELTDENALYNLIPVSFYTRVLKVSYAWEGRRTEKRWTLVSEGDCWKLSDEADEIFCDGEKIYSFAAGFASVSEGKDWESEIGAASLEEIRARLSDPDYSVTVNSGERTVQIHSESVDGLSENYEVDVESGLILSENSRFGTETVRTVSTESLTISEDYPVREAYEELTRAFYEAHPELYG